MKQLLKYILSQILEHQKMAETKHGVAIALISGFVVAMINFISSENILIKTAAIVSLIFCMISGECSINEAIFSMPESFA